MVDILDPLALIKLRWELKVLLVDVANDDKLALVALIKLRWELKVLFVDVVNDADVLLVDVVRAAVLAAFVFTLALRVLMDAVFPAMLVALVMIRPSCDVSVVLVLATTVSIALRVAAETGLFKSEVFSTLLTPIVAFETP